MDFTNKYNSNFKIDSVKVNNSNSSIYTNNIEQYYDEIDYSDKNISDKKEQNNGLLEGLLNADSWYVFGSEWTDIIDSSGAPFAALLGASLFEGLLNAFLVTSAHIEGGTIYNMTSFIDNSKDIFSSGVRGVIKSFVAFISGTDDLMNVTKWFSVSIYGKFRGLVSGINKNISGDAMEQLMKNVGQSYVLSLSNNVGKSFNIIDDVLEKRFSSFYPVYKLGKKGKVYKDLYSGYSSLGSVLSEFGGFLGIDYLGSLAANFIIGIYDTQTFDLSVETMKYGSEFLKSSAKMICATAGGLIGGKTGKVVGMVIGTIIGDAQVSSFNGNEGWCMVAGAAQVGGALLGAGIFVFCASNPVGWAVGIALVAGAAVGYGLTYLTYQVVEHWDEWVIQPLNDFCKVVTEFASVLADCVVESVNVIFDTLVEIDNNRIEFTENVVDEITDLGENISSISQDYAENIGDRFSDLGNNIQDSISDYKNAEYSNIFEQAAGFASMCGDVFVETSDSCVYVLTETGDYLLELGEDVYDTACYVVEEGVEYIGDQLSTIAEGVSDWWDSATGFVDDLFGGWW